MAKLDGTIALITGGKGGIGQATAEQVVNEGAYVFITGRGDVSNLGDLDRLFAQIKREKGRLDSTEGDARARPGRGCCLSDRV
jgi:NAD(P)-dependent dehydrogenase (short-subunit alcohol dehydrogenase family)